MANERAGNARLSPLHQLFLGGQPLSLDVLKYFIEKGATVSKKYDLFSLVSNSQNLTLPILKYIYESDVCQSMRRSTILGNIKKEGVGSTKKYIDFFVNKTSNEEQKNTLKEHPDKALLESLCNKTNPNLECIIYLLEKNIKLREETREILQNNLLEQIEKKTMIKSNLVSLLVALSQQNDKNNNNLIESLATKIDLTPEENLQFMYQMAPKHSFKMLNC